MNTTRRGFLRTLIASTAAILAVSPAALAESPTPRVLNLFIWGDYIDPGVLRDFERESGIRVVESNFDSNESMLAKVESGAVAYDIITPSDYMVRVMSRMNLLQPLNHELIPNIAGLAPEMRDLAFDPQARFSVPYKWGVTGIGYNKTMVSTAPTSWGDLFDPQRIRPLRGLISMLDDQRETIGAALVYLGFSNNSTSQVELNRARDVLRAQKRFVAKYDSSAYYQSLASGEIAMALGYSQEIALAQAENPDIEFVIPREGATLYVDNLAIPRTSRNVEAAHAFINFILRPEISARIANFTRGPSPIAQAKSMIDEAVLNGIAYRLPPPELRLMIDDVGEAERLYNRIWTEIKGR